LWHKGATSGATQELRSISVDCDRDVLRFVVRQNGAGFCHTGEDSCFGPIGGVAALEKRLVSRLRGDVGGNSNTRNSYTHRVATEAGMLSAKLQEEAAELAEASGSADICHEAADLLYFTMVALARANVPFSAVEEELDRRDLVVSRRHGDVKGTAR
jgi:phosphoribosyl-ATP pyrophosphohydrolase/phosphoribosyl-AMP cyclohydrolase/histidinol dehydrogenase